MSMHIACGSVLLTEWNRCGVIVVDIYKWKGFFVTVMACDVSFIIKRRRDYEASGLVFS